MRFTFSLILLVSVLQLSAQEKVNPLAFNKALEGKKSNTFKLSTSLGLPFFDDFSYDGPYADPTLWIDEHAFVNYTYAIDPISLGVATLDGLDSNGLPHDATAQASQSLPSDTLTSQPIDLSLLSPADDVYLSFYYQAQGWGFELTSGDSLVLEFKNDSLNWERAWFSNGIELDDFQLAILKVDSTDYFHDDFQFRFRNYASITGNNDQWHLDHVRMDNNRSADDIILQDVAILYEPSSILTNYTEMPWNQFYNYQATELNSQHFLSLRNNDNVTINTTYEYIISEVSSADILASQAPSAINFSAGIILDQSLSEPFTITTNYPGDSVKFMMDYTIDPSGDQYPQNNNFNKVLCFGNQLAYDDGSSELSYGIYTDGASLAMEYSLNEADSLRAVAIFFTTVTGYQSDRFFSLVVWDDIDLTGGGLNANEIARLDLQTPEYQPMHNGFSYFILPEAVAVSGTFYIGMIQEGEDEFHLGYDKNNIADEHTYYNLSGEWIPSNLNGSVMMRPVLGGKLPTSVNVEESFIENDLRVYPVPADDIIYLSSESIGLENMTVSLVDMKGSTVLTESLSAGDFHTSVNIQNLLSGIYILEVRDKAGSRIIQKKIIKN